MQRIKNARRGSRSRGQSARCPHRPKAAATNRDASPSGIETLARCSGHALPTLEGAQTTYEHELHSELLYDLCAALVRCGIATAEHWKQAAGRGNTFVQLAIRSAITDERLDLLHRNIDYHLQVSDVIDRFGYERALETTELAVTINSGNCGYVEIGAFLEALEAEQKGLGASFYWQLTYSLYRVMHIYNHDDALMREEQLREWAEQEEEEAADHYELPEVEKGLPKCIRTSLKREEPQHKLRDRRLLLKHRLGKFGRWIERLRAIQRLSRLYPKAGKDLNETGYYDSVALPTLLVAFKPHDVITACFDEESQSMLEGSPEPALSIVFDPHVEEEVAKAKRIVERFILLNCELFQLVEDIQQWEKEHGHRDSDRGELSV